MAPNGSWKWTPQKIEKMAASLLAFMEDPEHVFFKEWCIREGIPASHVARFAEMSPTFAEALERASDIQELRLLQGGTSGKFHHAITKLVLTSKYGYSDRSDLAVTPSPARRIPCTVEECDRMIAEAQEQKRLLEGIVADARAVETAIVGG